MAELSSAGTGAPNHNLNPPMLAGTAAATNPAHVTDHNASGRAFHSPAAWIALISVLVLGLALDLGSKHLAFARVASKPIVLERTFLLSNPHWTPEPHPGMHIMPWSLLDLRLVINRGAVFGIAPNQRFFFIVFTMMALAAGLLVFGRFTNARSRMAHIAVGLILAGGIGNLYDRIVFGVVRDFLHLFPGWHLPNNWRYPPALGGGDEIFPWVFNVADLMLLAGMALLMIHINRTERKRISSEPHPHAADSA